MSSKKQLSGYTTSLKRDLGNTKTQLQICENKYWDIYHKYIKLKDTLDAYVRNTPREVEIENSNKPLRYGFYGILMGVILTLVILAITKL